MYSRISWFLSYSDGKISNGMVTILCYRSLLHKQQDKLDSCLHISPPFFYGFSTCFESILGMPGTCFY